MELILYFFLYSFFGWLCECIYCSIPAHTFINRGFLAGPYCPIYGCGALAVLHILDPFGFSIPLMFVGEVEEAEVLSEEEVMTYAYYHQVKNGATPKNAPSYQEKSEKSGWRCTICGYIYEGDPLPQDYVCPLCGAPAALFEKL